MRCDEGPRLKQPPSTVVVGRPPGYRIDDQHEGIPMLPRRDFLDRSARALVGLGLVGGDPSPQTNPVSLTPQVDYYQKLGVPRIINAAGTYTYLTASTMPRPVREAIE